MRYGLAIFLMIALSAAALASTDIVGKIGRSGGFTGRNPISGGIGSGTPAATGKILLVDGVSFILQTNGTSKICRAGGC